MESKLEQEYIDLINEKNKELHWMRRKVAKMAERENEYLRFVNNFKILEKTNFGKSIVIPWLEKKKGYRVESISQEDIKIIKKSKFFDKKWYLKKYPDLKGIDMSLAEHYLREGWKERRDPSLYFSTKEYLNINSGVRSEGVCPLLHYEKSGKYNNKQYRLNAEDEIEKFKPTEKQIQKWHAKRERSMRKKREIYASMEVEDNKIVFINFQNKYTCNTKYICEELIKRNTELDIVWIYNPKEMDYYDYPRNVKLIPYDDKRAKKEIATAKIIIDNGVVAFDEYLNKKDNQISICTWHGSLGFKKMGADVEDFDRKEEAINKFSYTHDAVITNSTFEEKVFRTSHWPNVDMWRLGHARNDILINDNAEQIEKIRRKIYADYGIEHDKKIVLYAPTFRDDMLLKYENHIPDSVKEKGVYNIDFNRLKLELADKFGGEWVVFIRHHFVNISNRALKKIIPKDVIDVSKYTDIQELMVACDVGITDYSSWILDYIHTKKPGFLYTVDEDEFSLNRGMYYPLRESPLPVANDMEELIDNIKNFNQNKYETDIDSFLKEKGSIDDGHASERIADKIMELIQ